MMFSSHIDMIYKNTALQYIYVKLLFIGYRLSKTIPLDEKRMSMFTFHFGSITKGAKSLNSGYLLVKPRCNG